MGLVNRSGDLTPFDMKRAPARQNLLLLPLIWAACFAYTRGHSLKIRRIAMEGINPPYLVLSTHQGVTDYAILPLALMPHRANYVSDIEGFAAFGQGLYRQIGCIGKRRYVPELSVMKNLSQVLQKNGDIAVLFPEARHSNVGTTSRLPDNLGRLCKRLGVPVVTVSIRGGYLSNPFWDEANTRRAPIEATVECICDAASLARTGAAELQSRIEQRLSYDEYRWQRENKIRIEGKGLAKGLHKPLYRCISCKSEFSTVGAGNTLRCGVCGKSWRYTCYGDLEDENGKLIHIPDWYEWERGEVGRLIDAGGYDESFEVRVEALANSLGFYPLGRGLLRHTTEGFTLEINERRLQFSPAAADSVQTEYDYRGHGPCIVLSDRDFCFYIYSDDSRFCPTKLQFAAEHLHDLACVRIKRSEKGSPAHV